MSTPTPPPVPPVPTFVDAEAQRERLGPYRQTLPSGMAGPYLLGLGITAVLLCCVGTQVWKVAEDMASGPYVDSGSGSSALYLFAVGLFTVAVLAVVTALVGAHLARDRFICLYERGFVRVGRGRATAYRWDAVRSVNQKAITTHVRDLPVGARYRLRITFADGRVVRLNSLTGRVLPFVPFLRAGIRDTQEVPALMAGIRDDGPVHIGPYAVTADGVSVNGAPPVSWRDLTAVTVTQGRIVLIDRKRALVEAAVPVPQVPDPDLFLALARRAIAERGIHGPAPDTAHP